MDHYAAFDLFDSPELGSLYEASLSVGGASLTAALPARDVEYAVAQHLTINPILEGCSVFLQFNSPGDGFSLHAEESCGPVVTVGSMVEAFLEGDDVPLKEEAPELYLAAAAELASELKRLAMMIEARLGIDA